MKEFFDIEKTNKILEGMISREELERLGWYKDRKKESLSEDIMKIAELTEKNITKSQMFTPQVKMNDKQTVFKWQGKSSDGEIALNFEDFDDAVVLYNFIIENEMLEPGEITFYNDEHQNSLHLASHVLYSKPEVFEMIMKVYDGFVIDDEENMEAFESIGEELNRVLVEKFKVSGAPKKRVKGNPFHNDAGEFSGPGELSKTGYGSFSSGKTKLKYSKSSKSKKGDVVVHFAATKKPCGRNARKEGKDVRCLDGKPGFGSRDHGKKKESVDIKNKTLSEVINKYKNMD